MSKSLRPHELQHTRPPCPSPTPEVHPNSCPSSRWCHPAISSSVVSFSSCLQSFPASESWDLYTCNYVAMAFLPIFLVEGTKALREKMVLKSWNKAKAGLTYDPKSLDIQFNLVVRFFTIWTTIHLNNRRHWEGKAASVAVSQVKPIIQDAPGERSSVKMCCVLLVPEAYSPVSWPY